MVMSTIPSALRKVERFDIGMDSPFLAVASDGYACVRKGSARKTKAAGKYILTSDLEEPQTGKLIEQ
jgi:hypothetical protein